MELVTPLFPTEALESEETGTDELLVAATKPLGKVSQSAKISEAEVKEGK